MYFVRDLLAIPRVGRLSLEKFYFYVYIDVGSNREFEAVSPKLQSYDASAIDQW